MKNRVNALRASWKGEIVLLPVEYNDAEALVCENPIEQVSIPYQDEGQFERLYEKLCQLGFAPYGCFNCLYFHQPGATDDVSADLGYCLEGKLGKHVKPPHDFTTKERCCDAYEGGNLEERQKFSQQWADSLPVWKKT